MMTGEVKAKESEVPIVQLNQVLESQTEISLEIKRTEVSINRKMSSNLRVKKRFSRLKNSLRKRSVIV